MHTISYHNYPTMYGTVYLTIPYPTPPCTVQCTIQIKKPAREPDLPPQHSAKPKSARMTEAMKACAEIIKEMFSKKHSAYAWPFYKPVDTEQLDLHDYKQVQQRNLRN